MADRAPILVAPLAAGVAYLPTVIVPYAFMDDYYDLAARKGLGGAFVGTLTSYGRPFQGFFLAGMFSLAGDLDSLRVVRLISLLGVMLLVALLYYALRRAAFGRWFAVGVCVSVVSLPSFQVYASWASASEAPYAAVLGGLAWLRLSSADGLRGRAGATALLICAVLTYQPAAMFFWVFAAIDVLRPGQRLRAAARTVGGGAVVAIAALGAGYVAVRIGLHFYGGTTAGRTHLVDDVPGKLRWFWNESLTNSLNLFGLVPSVALALGVLVLAATGLLLLHSEQGRDALGFLGLAAVLVPLTYFPNLVVAEEFASYRSVGALATLLMVFLWLALLGVARAGARMRLVVAALLSFLAVALVVRPLWELVRSEAPARPTIGSLTDWPELVAFAVLLVAIVALWRHQRVLAAALALFVVTGLLVAARNVTTLVVKPQSIELQMLRTALHDRPRSIVLVKPNVTQGAAPLVRYDEFGPPSTYFAWVPVPAVLLVINEESSRKVQPAIDVRAWDDAPAASGDVVDMRRLREHRVGWSVWTLRAAR